MTQITKTIHFPKTFMASRKYLRSLSGVNKEGCKMYTTMLVIGHELPSKEIQDCMREWASADNHYFFKCTIQAKQVATVTWGFGLPNKTNSKELAQTLMEKLDAKFQIGCKDHFMADGSKWSNNPRPQLQSHPLRMLRIPCSRTLLLPCKHLWLHLANHGYAIYARPQNHPGLDQLQTSLTQHLCHRHAHELPTDDS
jgi:hypothetical protein